MPDPFAPLLLKEYPRWRLYLGRDQSYLGYSYLWLARDGGMQRFSALSADELAGLMAALGEIEGALGRLWHPDHMNYAWLGNHFHEHGGHGHMHVIPRYAGERSFAGEIFRDERWGRNYAPREERLLPEPALLAIRDAVRAALGAIEVTRS